MIEQAFLDSYRYLQKDNDDVLNEFVDRVLKVLKEEEAGSTDAKVEKELRQAVARRKSWLICDWMKHWNRRLFKQNMKSSRHR